MAVRRMSRAATIALGAGTLAFVLMAIFAVRVLTYYRGIKSGRYEALPQFSSKLTKVNGQWSNVNGQSALAMVGADDDPALGNPNAPLTIIQFADFECPFSREAFTTIRSLMAEFGGQKVRFIFRDMPLDEIHPRARAAAIAASCAGAQGKFWQMHDKLYQNSASLADADLTFYASQIGLDARQFAACQEDPTVAAEINADLKAGAAAGVRGTPTFFFNGRKIEGAIPPPIFKALIERFIGA